MANKKTKGTQKDSQRKLSKIIYFDESSVTDYIQIIEGGKLEKTIQLLDSNSDNASAGVEASVSVGIGKIFKSLIGFGANAEIKSNMEASAQSESLVKTILHNTILTDFLDTASAKKSGIEIFEDVTIKIIQDSLGYIIMVSPFMKMLKTESVEIDTQFSLDIGEIDDCIRLAKGYFEFEGIAKGESFIFRFNINSFKNNYKISDLVKMNLTLYAIPVGNVKRENISIVSEINAVTVTSGSSSYDNPTYGESEEKDSTIDRDLLKVYDVLLAGVLQDG